MDDPVEPRGRVSPGVRLRSVRRRWPRGDHRGRPGGDCRPHRWARVRSPRRAHEGCGTGRHQVPASSLRSGVARGVGRLRHARTRHRRRSHRAWSRRRRLPHGHQVRPRDLCADRTGRTLPRQRATVRRSACVRRQPEGGAGARRSWPALASRDLLAPVSALLALSQPGDLPRDVAVVRAHGRRRVGDV